MKVDILAIGVHPDDVELCASGTVMRHIAQGRSVGLLDLTAGELGTRGNSEIRIREADAAAKYMGVEFRENAGLRDGFFSQNEENLLPIVRFIRHYQPTIVLTNALKDRHPDHGRAADLVYQACFLAGLVKIQTQWNGALQSRWRPQTIYHFIQDQQLHPHLVIDITGYMQRKMEAIMCFKSQFYDPESQDMSSPISGQDFLHFIQAAARVAGRWIGAEFAESFNVRRPIGVNDFFDLL